MTEAQRQSLTDAGVMPGDQARIYSDPVTRSTLEGIARIVRVCDGHCDGTISAWVRFDGDGEMDVFRRFDADDVIMAARGDR